MTRKPTLGVVPLGRGASGGARRECIRLRVVVEDRVAPSAAVGKPLAVLSHEINVNQVARYGRLLEELVRFRSPVNLGHLRSVRDGLTVAGYTCLIRLDHCGV